MLSHENGSPSFVDPRVGQEGNVIRAYNLPHIIGGKWRWTPLRRAIAVLAVKHGLKTQEELSQQFNVPAEEFAAWEERFDAHGAAGLLITETAKRPHVNGVPESTPPAEALLAEEGFPLRVGNLTIHLNSASIEVAGTEYKLKPSRYRILRFLAMHKDKPVGKTMLYEYLYEGVSDPPKIKIIDMFVSHLRKDLREAGADVIIETEWGLGYRLRAASST